MDPVIDLTLRAALGLLFAVAAAHKLRDPRRFAATLAEYRVLPAGLAGAASALLVALELAVVAALVVDRRLGLAGAAALLGLYAGAMATNLARGRRHIDCGCAGPAARRTISGWLVVRNVVLACVALAGLAPIAPRVLLWIDGFTVVAATAAVAACWTAADRLLALAPGLAQLRETV
jgi:Methylamine utilisation protein MauE